MTEGIMYVILGAALAVSLAGAGSALGLSFTTQAAMGAISENPKLYSKIVVIQLLPATQGIYGLVVAFVSLFNMGILSGMSKAITLDQGRAVLMACIAIAVGGLVSAYAQGKAGVAAINGIAKRSEISGKGLIMVGIIETYALLSFVIAFLTVLNI